ncbi:hypothetical protein DUNSADRAFT_1384 [Dunaliella salina]|uniref:DUF1995 domain-containing protein n=1 Tax=Dunaliella salina TaxID=3046 RepID=A0ABQ7FXJ9_DUNSA|nr:hypothetical protein DUNSADRAFT_1384 [Dunaliella salina]|eukprot:KAF5827074.1 hypothetical protein DUNSADRAFT_1384 [Dunaliella salina]
MLHFCNPMQQQVSTHKHSPAVSSLAVHNRHRSCKKRGSNVTPQALQPNQKVLIPFPTSYDMAIRQVQTSVQASMGDGKKLLEIEFPPSGLASVQGDGEGSNEMTASMNFLRQ